MNGQLLKSILVKVAHVVTAEQLGKIESIVANVLNEYVVNPAPNKNRL